MESFDDEDFQFEQGYHSDTHSDSDNYGILNTNFDFEDNPSTNISQATQIKSNIKSNKINKTSKKSKTIKASKESKASKTNLIDSLLDNAFPDEISLEEDIESDCSDDEIDINNLTLSKKSKKSKKNKIVDDKSDDMDKFDELNNIEKDNLKEEYNKLFKKYWNFDNLKDTQFNIITEVVINRRDVCAILATGFGKSICYQLPHLINNKVVIVVSPLISLMNDQYTDMKNKNIDVCVFNSEEDFEKINKYKKEIYNGKGKIIYMTPEYALKSQSFIEKIQDKLELIAIDEAHAISTWGLDFRKSYTKLSVFKEWAPNIPILTLTATASTRVREDIIRILDLNNHKLIQGDFDRPNLIIRVYKKRIDSKIPQEMLFFLNKYKKEYMIIYCNTRDKTDELTEKIQQLGINCGSYHAGMTDTDKNNVQQKFIKGELKCIVATVAFGMGINIPKIRLVLHFNCPKNMESYYQEIGRAGRDGEVSECVLFYSSKDFKTSRYFLQNMTNKEQQAYQEGQIKKMDKYVSSNDCRRKLILENFGQIKESCKRCDNCMNEKKKNENLTNYTKEAYLVLSILNKLDGKFGMTTNVNILLGRKTRLKDYMFLFEEFSKGNTYGTEEFWKEFYRYLIRDEYIKETQDGFYITLSLTPKGNALRLKYFAKYFSLDKLIEGFDNMDKSLIVQFPEIKFERKAPKKGRTISKITNNSVDDFVINKKDQVAVKKNN